MKIVSLNCLNILIGNRVLLKDVSLDVNKGDIVHIVGKNGSGKSSLLNEIIKHVAKDNQFSFMPQVAGQFTKIHFKLKDVSSKEYSFYSKKLFEKSWHKSSGGERQKSLISKALNEGVDLVILDEPFNHLDQESCKEVVQEIYRKVSKGCTLIYTGHQGLFKDQKMVEVDQWK